MFLSTIYQKSHLIGGYFNIVIIYLILHVNIVVFAHLTLLNSVGDWRKSGGECLLQFLYRSAGEIVATVVELVVGVSFDFDETHLVDLHKGEKLFPQIDVFHLVLACGAPSAHNPSVYPALQKGLDGIGTVAIYGDDARLFEHFKPLNNGGELHTVVGGGLFCAACLFFVAFVEHHAAPTADTRISGARTVCINFNFLFHTHIVHNFAVICNIFCPKT